MNGCRTIVKVGPTSMLDFDLAPVSSYTEDVTILGGK